MRREEFTKGMWGRLIRTPAGYQAFVPNALPPALDLSWELVGKLSAAQRNLSELSGIARNLPNPHLLIGPFVRREAVLSSRIEGTQASLSDLFYFEAADSAASIEKMTAPDVQEVANYVLALEYGLRRAKTLPLCLRLIREMHQTLMKKVGPHLTPGEFRRSQNWIGAPGCALNDAKYVPPPVPEMKNCLGNLEKFLHAESPLPILIRLALVHYQFEAIHPFLDGNGRIGRLLISLLLVHEGLLPSPVLYLSAFFERRRSDYYRLLLAVSREGRWAEWIDFFLLGVAEQARDASLRAGKLLDLREKYRRRFVALRSSSLMRLVDEFFQSPALSVSGAARKLKVTYRAANRAMQKLVRMKLVKEVTGRTRERLFAAQAVIDAIERERIRG